MRRFILAIALLVATVASCLAQTQPVPKGCVLRGRGMVAPAYLAVNDPCLGSAAAVGDGMIQPATYSMESGSANIYLTYTAQVLVTLSDSTSSDVLTISPCVARQEWNYSTGGVVYRVNVYGAGATSTITANAASSGTNIIHVASGGTSVPLYSPVTDTTTGANIPSGTYVTATTATNITLNQDVTVAPSDVVQYAATLYGQINGISAGGCTITINTPPTTAVLSNLQYLTVTPAPNACGTCTTTAVSAQWAQWRYDQCGIAANSKSLICPAGTFYSLRDVTQGTSLVSRAYLRSVVAIHDPTGTCADLYAQIISTDSGGDTATLDRAASCAITSSNFAAIYWGSALFATSYHGNLTISAQSGTTNVNTSIDVPGIGSGSVAGAPVDLVTTVSSVTDYLSATLAASASVATSPSPYGAYLRWGTDDTAATIAACTAAAAATNPGYHGCYWPSGINTFMASMSVAADRVDGLLQTTRCGDGSIIWPIGADWHIGISDCVLGSQPNDQRTALASQDGKQARTDAATGTLNIAVVGDSTTVPGVSQNESTSNFDGLFRKIVTQQNRGVAVTIDNFSIGGEGIGELDPVGPSYGYGSGLPNEAPASLPDFYQTNTSAQWISYAENDANTIDMIVSRLGGNDEYNFMVGSFESVINFTQSAAWHTQNSKYPDWRQILGAPPLGGLSLAGWNGQLVVAGLQRSMIDSGWFNSIMQTSKSMGYIDADMWEHQLAEGWSPVNIPYRFAMEVLPPAPVNDTGSGQGFPYYWPEPVFGVAVSGVISQSGSLSNATFFGNIANGFCLTVGNGAAMTPWLSGTQTGAHVAYPGGAFCVDYNTSTGNYNINRYLYRTVQTNTCALANSGSGGVAVMTCNTAIINMGFARGQAYVAGGGSATCPAYMGGGTNCFAGTIASGGVNSAGTAVTFTAAAGTTFSAQSTKVEFYRLQPGDPVITGGGLGASGCAPHLTTPNTQVYVYLYVDADGNAGFSEGVGSQFEEGTYRCQWTGKMAGFFENNFYPSLRTEDNASHPYFNIHTSGGNGYATAWEQVTRSSRPAMQYTSVEDTGLCPNYSGAFGGACYAHPSGTGVVGIYDRAYENADWNFLQ